MGELTAVERRRILRERRAKKLASNASDRLEKIAGLNGSMLDKRAKAEAASIDSTPTTANTATSSEGIDNSEGQKRFTASTASSESPDLTHLKIIDPLHKNPSEETVTGLDDTEGDIGMDELLRKLMQGMDHSQQHDRNSPEPAMLPDDFMKTMSSMLKQSMEGGNTEDTFPALPQSAMGSAGAMGKLPEQLKAESELKEYNDYRVARLQVFFTFARYIGIFILVITQIVDFVDYQASFQNLRPTIKGAKRSLFSRFSFWSNGDIILRDASSCRFWNSFVILEIVSSFLYHFARSRFPPSSPNMLVSLASGFIPRKYKWIFDTAFQQKEILSFIVSDLALVIVIIGMMTYFEIQT
ncbi:hypothetical protein FOA43_000571 [Brettanomyces nanus]|uniref:Golgi to ER traffic protein 2 n=1 Tax=Eeniella nana TaxID=13502 RepID=A0A875RXJ0_EENNA|nr:uncharacterized protein FOA43_000571 [Brettanomyces nanus]QPG73263.1 hypothetical protein FOA43_000571 [Brettanomyces nanus]